MTTVIKVEGISKTFKIHHERHQSLKERMLHPRSGSTETFNAFYFTPAISNGTSLSSLFSTHPPLQKRLDALAKLEAEMNQTP